MWSKGLKALAMQHMYWWLMMGISFTAHFLVAVDGDELCIILCH